MTSADDYQEVRQADITLTEGLLGYNIRIDGEHAGAIEGIPGHLEYIELELHWEGKGVARAAINEFIDLSLAHGATEVTATNATHPAMGHILETEEFEEQHDDTGWVKQIPGHPDN